MDARQLGARLLLLSLLCCGCVRQTDATVSGTVAHGGKPLTTGAVTFRPAASGPLAIGDIQSDGKYALRTGDMAGLKAGEYLVTVVATGPMPEATAADPMPLPKLLVPARYGDVKTSGLKYTIKQGVNNIDIVLDE